MTVETHRCQAEGCSRPIPRRMLMCMMHWRRVPRAIQLRVIAAYQLGQCFGKVRPTAAWFEAAREAIAAVRSHDRDDR